MLRQFVYVEKDIAHDGLFQAILKETSVPLFKLRERGMSPHSFESCLSVRKLLWSLQNAIHYVMQS